MNPTELHLVDAAEQTLLVHTETARLADLTEDELDDLFTRVRRARTKYTKLYRRQSADLVEATSSRSGTSTSNQRTTRKAEFLEDALARAATALGADDARCGEHLEGEARHHRRQARNRSFGVESSPGIAEIVRISHPSEARWSMSHR